MFIATGSGAKTASANLLSGTIATPASIASFGCRKVRFSPSSQISPDVIGRSPKIARKSEVRPEPIRPATPRISPRDRLNEMSRAAAAVRFLTSSVGRWSVIAGGGAKTQDTGFPTIRSTRRSSSSPSALWVPALRPSRSAVTRSATSRTSFRWWVTKTIPWPSLAYCRRRSSRSPTSCAGRAAVGSSRIRSPSARLERPRARAMATWVRAVAVSCRSGVSGLAGMSNRSIRSRACFRTARQRMWPPTPVAVADRSTGSPRRRAGGRRRGPDGPPRCRRARASSGVI